MNLNNSLCATLLEIASLATCNFKNFRESIPPDPLGWIAPSGESDMASIYAACYYALLDPCEHFCEEPLSGIGKTRIRRLHHGGFVNMQVTFLMTVTGTKYKRRKVNMCATTLRGDNEIYK